MIKLKDILKNIVKEISLPQYDPDFQKNMEKEKTKQVDIPSHELIDPEDFMDEPPPAMTESSPSSTIPPWNDMWTDMEKDKGQIYGDPPYSDVNKIKANRQKKYNQILNQYQKLQGKPCWRIMFLQTHFNNISNPKTVGTSWSIKKWPNDEAIEWAGNTLAWHGNDASIDYTTGVNGWAVMYEAVIDLKNVEWKRTLQKRMNWGLGDLEWEIIFKPQSPILVKNVSVFLDNNNPSKIKILPINKIIPA